MRVAVVAPSPVPFRQGGAERLSRGLAEYLDRHTDHQVELIKLPTRELTLPDLLRSYLTFTELDLSHFDLIISGKYPAWMVEHPNHVLYLLHPLRGLYDSYPTTRFEATKIPTDPDLGHAFALIEQGSNAGSEREIIESALRACERLGADDPAFGLPGPVARRLVQHLDRAALAPNRIRRHFAISATVANRQDYLPPGIDAIALWPPTDLPTQSRDHGSAQDHYIFTVSRLDQIKRIELLIRAMRFVDGPTRLIIAGDGPDRGRLTELAATDPRIELTGPISDDQLAQLYGRARAVAFVPRDEDYGYVTLEAMHAGRPVITVTDSGGPTELVQHGRSGLIVEPTAEALGEAITKLASDRELAQAMGRHGHTLAADVTWDVVAGSLLDAAPPRPADGPPRVVVASTYPVLQGDGGGAERCRAIYGALAVAAEVHIVSLTPHGPTTTLVRGGPNLTETICARSARHLEAEGRLGVVTGPIAISDIATSRLYPATPTFVRELRHALDGASLVVLAQPYLAEAVHEVLAELPDGSTIPPIVYDCHNHETSLKDAILPEGEAGDWWREQVARAESIAVTGASLISATTQQDIEGLSVQHGVSLDRFVHVPNGVETTKIRYVGPELRASHRRRTLARMGRATNQRLAIFVGSGHPPNLHAAQLIAQVAPELPHVTFALVGQHATMLAPDVPENVERVGPVTETTLDDLLSSADIALNPQLHGGGSNLKMLRYFAAGVPVVTTDIGARAIPSPHEMATVVTPTGFAEGITEVLANPAAAAERVKVAREWVEKNADWGPIGATFRDSIIAAHFA